MSDPAIGAPQQLRVTMPGQPAEGAIRPAEDTAEAVAAAVWGGAGGVVPPPDGVEERRGARDDTEWVISWLNPPSAMQLQILGDDLRCLGAIVAEPVEVDADAGLDAWRDHARSVKAGPFQVRPSWLGAEPGHDGMDLAIDPGRTFGSGSHQSTRMALELLAELPMQGAQVVDVGSGSGILGIAAALLGADQVELVELDPSGEAVGLANAKLNGVADRVVWCGLNVGHVVDDFGGQAADPPLKVVVANMLIGELELVAADLRRLAGSNGRVVLAGVLGCQMNRLMAAIGPSRRLDERHEVSETDPSVSWAAVTLQVEPNRASTSSATT